MNMRILLATDGTEAASGALHVASELAKRHQAAVEVVSVVEPLPMHGIVHAETMAIAQRELEEAGRMAMQRHVRETLAVLGGAAAAWPITVLIGSAAPTIVRLARDKGATLIVLGLGRHAVVDRCLGSETALQTMRLAHVPVLAVPAGTRTLPTRAVAAVDFTEFSRDAADTARQILQAGGTLHLAHVLWRPSEEIPWVGGRDWVEVLRERMREQLEDLARELANAPEVQVQTHFLEGDAAGEVLELVEAASAGLVAAGSHGAGFFSRLLMGSVSTRLVRGATRMVLIAPPRSVPAELEPESQEATEEVRAEWSYAAPAITGAPPNTSS